MQRHACEDVDDLLRQHRVRAPEDRRSHVLHACAMATPLSASTVELGKNINPHATSE